MVRLIIVNRTDDYYDDFNLDCHDLNDYIEHDNDFEEGDDEGCFEQRQWSG